MGVWRSEGSLPSLGPCLLRQTTGEEWPYPVPYSKLPIPPVEELQLRSDGENTGGCALGCQAELPPANKASLSKPAPLTPSLGQRGLKDMIPSCLWPQFKLRLETGPIALKCHHSSLGPYFQLPVPFLTSVPLIASGQPSLGGKGLSWPSALTPHLHMYDCTLEAH